MLINNPHDVAANARELGLHLVPVLLDTAHILIVPFALLLLLNRRQYPPRSPTSSDHVLVANRQQISLLDSELHVKLRHFRHRFHHFCQSFKR